MSHETNSKSDEPSRRFVRNDSLLGMMPMILAPNGSRPRYIGNANPNLPQRPQEQRRISREALRHVLSEAIRLIESEDETEDDTAVPSQVTQRDQRSSQ